MLCAVLFAVTGAGTGWAGSFQLFVMFRMLSGVAVGASALVCPMYVAEISPSAMRGRMVSFYQLSIVIGILLAYLSNYLLLNTGENNRRWMFSSQSAPSLLFFFGLFFVSESPRWLIGKGRNPEVDQILARIGGASYARSEAEPITLSFADTLALSAAFYFQLPGIWVLIFVLAFIAIYSVTLGPVIWVALSEIFLNKIRGNALAVATLALWIAIFFTTSLIPVMNKYFGLSVTF